MRTGSRGISVSADEEGDNIVDLYCNYRLPSLNVLQMDHRWIIDETTYRTYDPFRHDQVPRRQLAPIGCGSHRQLVGRGYDVVGYVGLHCMHVKVYASQREKEVIWMLDSTLFCIIVIVHSPSSTGVPCTTSTPRTSMNSSHTRTTSQTDRPMLLGRWGDRVDSTPNQVIG